MSFDSLMHHSSTRSIVVLVNTADDIVLVIVVGPRIIWHAFPDLLMRCKLLISLTRNKRGIVQVKDLFLDSLDRVSDLYKACNGPGNVAHDVE